jgi:hypothetical protein
MTQVALQTPKFGGMEGMDGKVVRMATQGH